MHEPEDVTALLVAWGRGDAAALERALPLVYDDLRRIARQRLRRERADHTLSATALVHEAYVRLLGQRAAEWRSRTHFFALSSQLMRRILVDHARRRAARGGAGRLSLTCDAALGAEHPRDVDLLALDAALDELARHDARAARLVELRFFGGLSNDEAAQALNVSRATAERDWAFARAWLHARLA